MAQTRNERPQKPTPAQAAVLGKIVDGEWELGRSVTMDGQAWVQRGGIGFGGESANVHGATFLALWRAKWVASKGRAFPTERYEITNAGREALARLGVAAHAPAP